MKKIIAVAALAVLLAALVFIGIAFGGGQEETVPTTEATVTTTQAATTESTVEVTIPGLEDSIFDDETEAATEATEATEETKSHNQGGSATKPTEASHPKDPEPTKPKPTEPKPTEPEPTEPKPSEGDMAGEYIWFQSLNPADQQAHMESFDSIEAFFAWYNAAREAYEQANPSIEVGSGSIDIGAIIAGKE